MERRSWNFSCRGVAGLLCSLETMVFFPFSLSLSVYQYASAAASLQIFLFFLCLLSFQSAKALMALFKREGWALQSMRSSSLSFSPSTPTWLLTLFPTKYNIECLCNYQIAPSLSLSLEFFGLSVELFYFFALIITISNLIKNNI